MKKLTIGDLLIMGRKQEEELRKDKSKPPDSEVIMLAALLYGLPHILQRLEELEEGVTLTADIHKRIGERQDELFKLLEELVSET